MAREVIWMNYTEIWKDVEGFEGFYQISNLGRIKSLDRMVRHSGCLKRIQYGKILKVKHDGGGYQFVILHKNNQKKPFKIHRLVALAFINNASNKSEVNHLDENKDNNIFRNLNWVTRLENENWGTKRIRQAMHTDYSLIAKKNSKRVMQFDTKGKLIKVWDSLTNIHKQNGYSKGNISMCCNGKYTKPLYGYFWKYCDVS